MPHSLSNKPYKERLRNLGQTSRWLWNISRGYRLQSVLNAIVGSAQVGLDLLFVWATKFTIDIATHVRTDYSLSAALAMLVCIIVFQIAMGIASRWIKAILGVRAQNSMQRRIFAHLLQSKWASLRKYHTGDLLNRLERDVTDVIQLITEHLPALLHTVLQFIGAFAFLYLMDKGLALIVVIILPVFIVASRLYVRPMRRITHQVRATESNVQSLLQESLQHSLVLKTLGAISGIRDQLWTTQKALHTQIIKRTKYATITSALMNVGFGVGYMVAFGWGVVNLEAGLITYGTLVAFVQLVAQIQSPVRSLTKFVPIIIGSLTASERLIDLQDIEEEPQQTPLQPKGQGAELGISLNGVSYAYPDASKEVISRLNFNFAPGSITAIVGETGAGKTTLLRLLLNVMEPTSGALKVYDKYGGEWPLTSAVRHLFAYVPQGNTLLSGTLRYNLLLANPDATDEELYKALEMAEASFVKTLPNGLDTHLGELGDGFSEGQAQRISIARALLRQSPVYIFDEATSALDEATEQKVVGNIVEAKRNATLIFVTHRPEVLKYATQQLRLE